MRKFGDAHLEIIRISNDTTVRIKGDCPDVVFVWMQLTASIAESVHVPLLALLAQCAVLGPELEKLNRAAEDCRIDLSIPIK